MYLRVDMFDLAGEFVVAGSVLYRAVRDSYIPPAVDFVVVYDAAFAYALHHGTTVIGRALVGSVAAFAGFFAPEHYKSYVALSVSGFEYWFWFGCVI